MDFFDTIEQAFGAMEQYLSEEQLYDFLDCPYEDLCMYHFGFGLWIRNQLLIEESALYRILWNGGVLEKDDMSLILIGLFYIHMRT